MASLVAPLESGAGPQDSARNQPSPDPALDPEIGRMLKGKYRLVEQLGSGGMAVVYLAREEGLINRDVAIKFLRPESELSQAMLTRFLKEAQAIADINHQNVVKLIEIDRTEDGQIFIVMERLVGKPLNRILHEMREAGQYFAWERLAPLILHMCRALLAAHKRGIVHRDMKPGNCFCCGLEEDEWHVKILDFGIAKARASRSASEDSMETPLTQDGMFIGTPHYAAPEVIRQIPDHEIDGRADIFALGVMMYQCMTGTLPFAGEHQDKFTILYRTLHERPQPPRERAPDRHISPEVDALIMRAMEADPGKRFADIAELMAGIRATLRMDVSGVGESPIHGAVLEQTPRPPGEPAGPLPPASALNSGAGAVTAASPGAGLRGAPASDGPLTALAQVSSPEPPSSSRPQPAPPSPASPAGIEPAHPVAARAGTDQATPPPPGEAVAPVTSPTALQQIPERTSRAVLVVIAAMSIGVLVLMLLFIYEVTRRTTGEPARLRGTTSVPTPRPPPKPVAPPVVKPVKHPPEPVTAPEVGPPDDPAPPPPPPPPTPRPATSDADDARKRAARSLLSELVATPAMIKCLPLNLAVGDGVFDEIPVTVRIDAAGKATAKASSRGVKQRLPKKADACILKVIEAQAFPGGEGAIVVSHTFRFD